MSGVSPSTGTVDFVFWFITGISIFFLVLITFLMIFFIFKYQKKRHKTPKDIHGNTLLEITWTVIPTILVLLMFYFGWKGFEYLRTAPEESINVDVTGRMWSWAFEYQNGVRTDTLVVPVETPVKLNLHSQDVIHSFYIPAFRIKEDAVPGFNNYLWFEANREGEYDVLCAEYCGLRHAYMLTKIKAVPAAEYESWLAEMEKQVEQPVAAADSTAAETPETEASAASTNEAGQRLLRTNGCVACHTTDGSKLVGPSFKGLFGRRVTVIEDGEEKELTADEEYLRTSILKPGLQIVKGFDPLMPSQEGNLTEEQLNAIIDYLKEL
ncbi:MAG: cytochrome c oxidase subunit II [Calditrichia bacterium]